MIQTLVLGKVTKCAMMFREGSIGCGKKNCRPGMHTFWMVISGVTENGKLVSRFASSYLRIRKTPYGEVDALPREDWTNPAADVVRPGGSKNLSKAQKSKQWITGLTLWMQVCQASMIMSIL